MDQPLKGLEGLRAWAIGTSLPVIGVVGLVGSYHGPAIPEPTRVMPAYHHGGTRSMDKVRFVVLHSTESQGKAVNIAGSVENDLSAQSRALRRMRADAHRAATGGYFQSPEAGGSTQLVVGEDGIFRCVPDDVICAGAPPLNDTGLHIEIVGRAAWSREQWLERDTTLLHAAVCVAAWCRAYDIPSNMILEPGGLLVPGAAGITTHRAVSLAWHQSDHLDPGANFPYDRLMVLLTWLLA